MGKLLLTHKGKLPTFPTRKVLVYKFVPIFYTYTQTCSPGGFINLTVSGDNPPFTYEWYYNGNFYASTQDLSNVPNGTYYCRITDNLNNSINTENFIVNC